MEAMFYLLVLILSIEFLGENKYVPLSPRLASKLNQASVVLKSAIFFNLLILTKSCNFFFFSFFFYFNVSLSKQGIELHRIIDHIISLEKYLCKCQ